MELTVDLLGYMGYMYGGVFPSDSTVHLRPFLKKNQTWHILGGGFLYLDVILLSGFDEALHDFY